MGIFLLLTSGDTPVFRRIPAVHLWNLPLEPEEFLGIVVADVFNHLVHTLHFRCGNLAVFHIMPDEVAQRAAEVFVARVGEEGAGVCQHADKSAQQAEHGECVHQLFHSVLLVEEPPAGD